MGSSLAITRVTVAGGEVSELTTIAGAFERYYADLLQEQPAAKKIPPDILNLLPKIPEEVGEEIGGSINGGDMERAIAALSTGKSPGPDGIGNGFYKAFSNVLAPLLAAIFDDIRKKILRPPSMLQSHVELIPKKTPDD